MTLLRVSEKTLSGLDRFRTTRGIRTRNKALEVMLEELGVTSTDNLLEQIFTRPVGAKVLTEAEANGLALAEVKAHRQKH